MTDQKKDSSADDGFLGELDFDKRPSGSSEQFVVEEQMEENSAGNPPQEGGRKKILILLILLLAIGGYAGYTYLVPLYFSEAPPAKRIPVSPKLPIAPPQKPAPAEPAGKPSGKAEKTGVTVKQPEETKKPEISKPLPATIPEKASRGIKVIKDAPPLLVKRGYFVQAGAFIFTENLDAFKKRIEAFGYSPAVRKGKKTIGMNRVIVGEWGDAGAAGVMKEKLKKEGYNASIMKIEGGRYAVLASSFYYLKLAREEKIALESRGYNARIARAPVKMNIQYLLIGPYKSTGEVARVEAALNKRGIDTAIMHNP